MPFDVLAVTKAFLEDYPLLPLPFYSFVDTLNYVKQSSFADKVAEAALLGERVLNATKCTLELRSSNIPLCISKAIPDIVAEIRGPSSAWLARLYGLKMDNVACSPETIYEVFIGLQVMLGGEVFDSVVGAHLVPRLELVIGAIVRRYQRFHNAEKTYLTSPKLCSHFPPVLHLAGPASVAFKPLIQSGGNVAKPNPKESVEPSIEQGDMVLSTPLAASLHSRLMSMPRPRSAASARLSEPLEFRSASGFFALPRRPSSIHGMLTRRASSLRLKHRSAVPDRLERECLDSPSPPHSNSSPMTLVNNPSLAAGYVSVCRRRPPPSWRKQPRYSGLNATPPRPPAMNMFLPESLIEVAPTQVPAVGSAGTPTVVITDILSSVAVKPQLSVPHPKSYAWPSVVALVPMAALAVAQPGESSRPSFDRSRHPASQAQRIAGLQVDEPRSSTLRKYVSTPIAKMFGKRLPEAGEMVRHRKKRRVDVVVA